MCVHIINNMCVNHQQHVCAHHEQHVCVHQHKHHHHTYHTPYVPALLLLQQLKPHPLMYMASSVINLPMAEHSNQFTTKQAQCPAQDLIVTVIVIIVRIRSLAVTPTILLPQGKPHPQSCCSKGSHTHNPAAPREATPTILLLQGKPHPQSCCSKGSHTHNPAAPREAYNINVVSVSLVVVMMMTMCTSRSTQCRISPETDEGG